MSDIPSNDDPKAKKLSPREGMWEEGFGWVVSDRTDVGPEVERVSQGGEAPPPSGDAQTDDRSFQIPISALTQIAGGDADDLPTKGSSAGVSSPSASKHVSDLLHALPGAQHVLGVGGQPGALQVPMSSLGGSVGHSVALPTQTGGGPTGGQIAPQPTPTQLAFAGHPNGPAVVAMTATGFEDRPLKLMVSAVDGSAKSSSMTTHFQGLPPGATLSVGHPDSTGGWVVPAGTPLTGLQLIPAANWFGNGAIGITVTQPDGQSATTLLPFRIVNTPDAAVISGVSAGTVTEDLLQSVSGKLSVIDPDPGEAAFVHTITQGKLGKLEIDSSGFWTFTLDNSQPAVQGLKSGEQLTDTLTVSTVDGTTKQITVTINGTDDKAAISGTAVGAVTEDKTQSTGGKLDVTDPDAGQASFVPQTGAAGAHGAFTVQPDGTWSYTLDNSQPAVQGLKSGEQLTDTLTVSTVDGTTKQITVTINGTDDKAAISGTAVGAVTEDKTQSTGGKLDVTDPDAGQASFVSQTGTAGAHGAFTVQPDGTWSYTLDNSQPVVQGLKSGEQLTDTLTVSTVDGTTKQITVTINGTDDKAVIGGVDSGDVTENTAGVDKSPDQHQTGIGVLGTETLNASGKLTIIDPDAGESAFDTHGLGFTYHGTYGDLNLRADGTWFYSADAGNARFFDGRPTTRGSAIDQLGEGQTLTDTITVYSKDGTAHDITITIHGSNDAPYCASEVTLTPGTEDTAQTLTKAQLLANTVEVDANDAGKLSIAELRADHGSIRDNGDGTYTFTPARDYNGAVHFTYDVKDAHGGVTHTGATTTLAAVSDAAIIGGTDTGSATEDHVKGRIVINGLLTVSDPDGPSQEHFQYSQFGEHAISDPFGGNLHIDSSGSWSYVTDNSNPAVQQLAAGQEGHATYRVRSADGTTHEIQITIRGTNDAPVLSAATASATEDGSSVTGQMSATDVDTGDTLAYSLAQAAPAGFTLNADGSWSFDPTDAAYQHLAAGATERVTIPVTVTDGTDTDTQNLVITVTGTDDAATFGGVNTGSVKEDLTIAAGGKLSVIDPDTGESQVVAQSHVGGFGTFLITVDGSWTYQLDNASPSVQGLKAGETVTDRFWVNSADGSAHHAVEVTVRGTNDAPVLSAASASATEDGQSVTGQMRATDADVGDTERFSIAQPIAGFVIDRNGAWSFDPTDTAYQHLAAGATEQVTIPVTVTDGTDTDTQNLVITVTGTNDGPTVSGPVALPGGTEDKTVQITAAQLLEHATDVDTGDQLSVTSLTASHGTITGDAATGFTFTPDANYNGPVALSYTVTDGHGGSVAQTASLTLSAVGDPAIITDVKIPSVTEDRGYINTHYELQVYGKLDITDPDPGEASFDPNIGSQTYQGIGYNSRLGGHVLLQRDGNFIYYIDNRLQVVQQLGAGQTATDTTTIRSADGTTHQIQITIHGTNDAPALSAATTSATEDGSSVTGQMSATDVDTGDTQAYSLAQAAPAGFTLNADGSWSFDPTDAAYQHLAAGATEQVTIPVTVTDGAATDTKNLVITVTGTNDGPAVSGPVALPGGTEDKAVQITAAQLLEHATDVDTGDQLSVTGVTANHGQITGDAATGFTFTPDPNYNGPVALSYTVTDGHGGSVAQTATIALAARDDPAVVSGTDTGDLTEDKNVGPSSAHPIAVGGTLSVSDPDGVGSNHFRYSIWGEHAVSDPFGGSLHMDRYGNWHYAVDNSNAAVQRLAAGEEGHATYRVSTADGTTHQIQITIHGTNDAPVLSAATASATEDGSSVTGQMSATDVDTGDTLAYSFGQAAPAGFVLHGDGSWSFDPTDAAYQHLAAGATEQVTIPVTVTDGTDTDTQNLVITVTGTNDGPAVSGPVTLPGGTEDNSVHITAAQLLEHATDVDTGDQLSVTGLTASHGTITGDAAHGFTLTPDANYNGPVSLSYTVTDGHGGSVAQTASLTLAATGDAAVIGGVDTGIVTENTAGVDMSPDQHAPGMGTLGRAALSADGQLTIIDPDAGESQFDTRGTPGWNYSGTYGDLRLNSDGSWHYHADAGHVRLWGGHATTRGTVIDQLGDGQTLTDTITVYSKDGTAHDITITIHGSNDAPYCASEVTLAPGKEDTAQTLTKAQLLANTVEVDANDAGKLSIAGLRADHGSIRDNGDGTYTFTPALDYNGAVHFTYDVKDVHGGVTHTGATTTLAAASDAAIIGGTDTGSATEDHVQGRIVISGLLTVSDPDGASQEHFQYSQFGEHAISDPFGGNLHIDSSGSWSYVTDNSNAAVQQLAAGEEGHATYRVRSVDGTTHQIQITIHGTNDAPVLSAATASATEDGQSVTGQMSATDVDAGDTLAYSLGQTAPAGFTLNADGSWSFDPTDTAYQHLAAGQTEQITIPVTVTDGTATDTQNLVVTVTGTNDGPVVNNGDLGANVAGANKVWSTQELLRAVGATDVDDGDTLSITDVTMDPQYGSFHQSGTNWIFTPAANASHNNVPVTVSVSDGHATSQTSAALDVTSAPLPPTVTQVVGAGTQHLMGTLSGGTAGWAIDNGHGRGVTSLQGQYGILKIDPTTGHFEYQYQKQSAVIKHGGASMASGQHTDTFHILQHGTHTSDAEVHVNVHVQSVHGHSGHHVDQTSLLGIDVVPVAVVQSDEPEDSASTVAADFSPDAPLPPGPTDGFISDGIFASLEGASDPDQPPDDSQDPTRSYENAESDLTSVQPSEGQQQISPYISTVGLNADDIVGADANADTSINPYLDVVGVDATAVPSPEMTDVDPDVLEGVDVDAVDDNGAGDVPDPLQDIPDIFDIANDTDDTQNG